MGVRSTGQDLQGIQVLRAIAALAVVLHHSLEQSNGAAGRFSPDWLTTAGAAGVDIFFVISGFIMVHVSFRSQLNPTRPLAFLRRRAIRIYPLYWLCTFIMLAASSAGFMAHHHWGPGAVAASFMLMPNDNPLINVAWTLVYEVYFYLIFALSLTCRSITISTFGTSLALLGLLTAALALPEGTVRDFLTTPIALEFCLGMLLAWAFAWSRQRDMRWPVGVASGVVGLALLIVAPVFVWHHDTSGLQGLPRVAAWGLPSVLVVASVLTIGPSRNAIMRGAVLLGDASYALYLTHVFVMISYAKLLKTTAIGQYDQWFIVPVVVLVAAAIGLAAHVMVERPLLARIKNDTARQPAVSVSV
jgi:exopolysaccharide production protein ExoZ